MQLQVYIQSNLIYYLQYFFLALLAHLLHLESCQEFLHIELKRPNEPRIIHQQLLFVIANYHILPI
nr:MAG TPA: hypothetical protein [Caudoviricetes sp.]